MNTPDYENSDASITLARSNRLIAEGSLTNWCVRSCPGRSLPVWLARLLLSTSLLVPGVAPAQVPTSDVFSSSGQPDQFAVGGARKWYDNHSTEFKQKGEPCLSLLEEAKVLQDKALALYAEARRPGNSRQQSTLVRQANELIRQRGDKLEAFKDCVNEANRRPPLQGRAEKNQPPPKGKSDGTPERYKFGQPDPPFMFADGFSKGIGDCFAENLPGDLATAPLAVLKRLERIKKAVEVIGKFGSLYAVYEDIKAYDPNADPYETGRWLGKLVCDGRDLGEVLKQRSKPGAGNNAPHEHPGTSPSRNDLPAKTPSPEAGAGFVPKTRFPSAPDPLQRGMPLEDHKQLVKFASEENKIVVVRDSNPWAMRWMGRARHLPKPQALKAKTIPYDPTKSAAENEFAGLASAQGLSDADRRALLAARYTIRGDQQIIVDSKGNRFYSDTDLHGVFDSMGRNAWSDGLQQKMNDSMLENMVQHAPHDNWEDRNNLAVAGPNAGPKPPVTAYLPNGTTQHLKSIPEMKQFYTAHGIDWNSLYPSY